MSLSNLHDEWMYFITVADGGLTGFKFGLIVIKL